MDMINTLNSSHFWMGAVNKKVKIINYDFIPPRVKPAAAQPEQTPVLKECGLMAWSCYVTQELNQLRLLTVREAEGNTGGYPDLYSLTQVILNTLNSAPERFHRLLKLPSLESYDVEQVVPLTNYLCQQGWIEEKILESDYLVKLTMKGKLFVEQHNAWVKQMQ